MLLKCYVMLLSLVNCWIAVSAFPTTTSSSQPQLESCTTPSKQKGWCVPITMCSPLHQILMEKPISQRNLELLANSNCGFLSTIPKVCCMDHVSIDQSQIQHIHGITTAKPLVSVNDSSKRVNEKPTFLASQEDCIIDATDRVYRGEIPELVEYVFMSMLEFKNDLGQRARCSGVLISNRHVLTSAHCVTKPGNWTLTHVRLGEYNTETELDCFEYTPYEKDCTEGVIAPVERVTVHEDYNAKDPIQYNDIALVKLAQEVKYSEFVKPICIATSKQEQEDMKRHTGGPKKGYAMIGWNRTANHLIKRRKNAIVKEQTECQAKYNRKLDKNQLCCESHKSDYPKDLKSPVLISTLPTTAGGISWYLEGLSTYPTNPENGALRIYTGASGYADWIIDKVQQSLQKPRKELY